MDILVGIDFGTTNTVISYFENNKAHVLMDGQYKTIPSKIGKYNDKYYCGNYIPLLCDNIIINFKNSVNSEQLVIFFSHIYNLIIKKFGLNPIKAVITVPSNFNDIQRETIRNAFISVNINVIRIINEPSAAALSYGLFESTKQNETILVIDTGGGTIDFTILEKDEVFFQVIYSDGINDLGGNNFTQEIVNDMKLNLIDDPKIWNKAEFIKHKLTYLDNYDMQINGINYSLTKKKFEKLSENTIARIINKLEDIYSKYYSFDYLILVGGCSKLPLLVDSISKSSNLKPWIHPNADIVVALGAGLYAGIIENKFTSTEDIVLLDVVPLSLGIELADGTLSVIIPKNTLLPVKITQKYTSDIHTNIKVNVYQGERTIANKNTLIGSFIIDKISTNGTPIVDITFKIDTNSIINISVLDKKSGSEKNIILKNSNILEKDVVDNIIKTSIDLADIDDQELKHNQNIYIINSYIENAMTNLTNNELITQKDKNEMCERFKYIENNINSMSHVQLLEIIVELQTTYKNLINESIQYNETHNLEYHLQLDTKTKKHELEMRIKLLLNKNNLHNALLEPILEELSYNNTSPDYIDDKLELIEKLENIKITNHKEELLNLCLYLKSEISIGTIELNTDKINELTIAINKNLDLLNENKEYDWENIIIELNKLCEILYKN